MTVNSSMEDIFNGTLNGTFNGTTANSWESSYEEKIARMIFLTIGPILLIGGSFGNIISFMVLRRTDLKKLSTGFYMSVLAVVDTGNEYQLCADFSVTFTGVMLLFPK